MFRHYSRVEVIDGRAVPIYDDPEPEAVNFIVREIDEPDRPYEPDPNDIEVSESESEPSESEEPQYGTWQPEASCFIPEPRPEPEPETEKKPLDLDLWRLGLKNEDADVVIQFHRERLEKCEEDIKTTQTEVALIFNEWKEEKDRKLDGGINYNKMLFDFLEPRYCKKNKKVYWGLRVILTDEERERKEALERAKRDKEEMMARELEERAKPRVIIPEPSDEPTNNPKKLKDVIRHGDITIHRHPQLPNYGGDLQTGMIFRLKGNTCDRMMDASMKKGVVLSCGSDEDGKRIQKYFAASKFIAECGRLQQQSKFHTKLKINTECDAYKNRPYVAFYPLECLSYEYDGGLDFSGDIHKVKTGNALVSKCKTTKQIDEYINGIKAACEEKLKKYKDENARLKSRVANLEAQNKKLNTPLSAGALQLQELLMTKIESGERVGEMLQLCFKDITRDYPKDYTSEEFLTDTDENDGNYAHFGVFEMSPRGLPYDNEHLTR